MHRARKRHNPYHYVQTCVMYLHPFPGTFMHNASIERHWALSSQPPSPEHNESNADTTPGVNGGDKKMPDIQTLLLLNGCQSFAHGRLQQILTDNQNENQPVQPTLQQRIEGRCIGIDRAFVYR